MAILTATQGVELPDVLTAFEAYVASTAELRAAQVVRWDFPSRANVDGKDDFVWYSIGSDIPEHAVGMGRFGNRTMVTLNVHYLTRSFLGGSQRDNRRWSIHYVKRWRLYQAFQNLMLFNEYITQPELGPTDIWQPPQPALTAVPLTIEPMILDEIPILDRTDKEEASINTDFRVTLPIVLKLTLSEGLPPP